MDGLTQSQTITEFLEARIAEDEDLGARRVLMQGRWRWLDECAAKRALVEIQFQHAETIDGEWGDGHYAGDIREGKCPRFQDKDLSIIRSLATVYADHDDYRQEWARG